VTENVRFAESSREYQYRDFCGEEGFCNEIEFNNKGVFIKRITLVKCMVVAYVSTFIQPNSCII
jgi:hypothetical protein